MKDEFLTTLSHELRTPRSARSSVGRKSSPSATRPSPEQPCSRAWRRSRRNARIQVQLIEDLLDVSRITEGKLRLDVKQVALADVVELALDSIRPAADAKQIRIQTLLDRDSDHVNGDPARLQQIVWNLLSNAVRVHAEGRPHSSAGRTRELSRVMTVSGDTGEGITPEFLPLRVRSFPAGRISRRRARAADWDWAFQS